MKSLFMHLQTDSQVSASPPCAGAPSSHSKVMTLSARVPPSTSVTEPANVTEPEGGIDPNEFANCLLDDDDVSQDLSD